MAANDRVYSLVLSATMPPIDVWLSTYGRRLRPDELNALIHFKDQSIPKKHFIVWCDRALMGKNHAWILHDVAAVRILWHSLGGPTRDAGWYYIERTMAMPFTEAPVF